MSNNPKMTKNDTETKKNKMHGLLRAGLLDGIRGMDGPCIGVGGGPTCVS